MNNIDVIISRKTRKIVNNEVKKIGIDGENLQSKLIFTFDDEFVDGQARIEIEFENGRKNYITLTKNNESYELPIQSVIAVKGLHYVQLVIDEGTTTNVPIFKSERFYIEVAESINAVSEAPAGYDQWIEIANAKLNQIDNLNITASKSGNTATITITDKERQETSVEIHDGETGATGQDGKDGITPTIGNNGNWYLGDTDTGKPSRGIQGQTGATGQNGADGISPTVTTSKSGTTTTITITDKNGEHTATINDGVNGTNGTNGRDGYVQYTAGENITIENNVISATGGGNAFYLGNVTDYTSSNRLDISNLEVGLYCFNVSSTNDVLYVEGTANNISFTGSLNMGTNDSSYKSNYVAYLKINTKISTVIPTTSNQSVGVIFFNTTYPADEKVTYFTKTIRIQANSQGTTISISTSDVTFNLRVVTKNDNQTITGKKTFDTLPESSVVPTTNNQFTNKKYVDDALSTASGSYVGMLTELNDTNNANAVNFKKAKVGVYYNDKSRNLLYISSAYDDATGTNQIDNVEYFVITKDISSVVTPSSELDFGYVIYFDMYGKLKAKKLSVKTNGAMKETFIYTYPDIQILNENAQDIQGEKTFYTIPKLSSYSIPTLDNQLIAKKYVDDKIGDINTILATLTTPSSNS